MTKEILIFKAGTHIDSRGKVHTYSEDDLKNMAKVYNEAVTSKQHEAPVCRGHNPKPGDPAGGWLKKVVAKGDKLFGVFSEFAKDFVNDVKDGKYKYLSISHYANGLIRHVAALGAENPAVKGLGSFSFAELENEIVESVLEISFSESVENESTNIVGYDNYTESPEVLKLKADLEAANAEIESSKKTINELNSFKEDTTKLSEKITFAEDERDKAIKEANRLSMKLRKTEFEQYLNERIAYGQLSPVAGRKVQKLLQALSSVELSEKDGKNVFEFTDYDENNNETKVFANPIELMKEFIEMIPKKTFPADAKGKEFGEENIVTQESENDLLYKEANEYADKNNISFATALQKIKTEKSKKKDK